MEECVKLSAINPGISCTLLDLTCKHLPLKLQKLQPGGHVLLLHWIKSLLHE